MYKSTVICAIGLFLYSLYCIGVNIFLLGKQMGTYNRWGLAANIVIGIALGIIVYYLIGG